jgi:flagellar biosynthesis/type III secretory pathway protein FliH
MVRVARFPSFPLPDESGTPPAPSPAELTEAMRESGRREGLVRGRQEGRAAALAEWGPRLAALAAALEQALSIARAERERLAAEIPEVVPRAAVHLARKVIERELTHGEDALRAAVERVVRRLTQGDVLSVRVSPDVAEALAAWRGASDQPLTLARLAVVADAGLGRGDWIVETDAGFLDGRLATQLAEAERLLAEPEA